MLAAWYPTALFALNHRGVATTILEQYSLFTPLQRLTDTRQKQRRERPAHHLAVLQVLNIDDLNLRQFDPLMTFLQLHQSVLPHFRVVVGLKGGSGCP